MKTATIIFAACAILFSNVMPVSPNPVPDIQVEGRNFDSRFAPVAHPLLPRKHYKNSTKTHDDDGPTAVKRDRHADPTASGHKPKKSDDK